MSRAVMQMDWDVDNILPRFEDRFHIEIWDGTCVRKVRRIGNRDGLSITPGTLIYTDCTHPMQNMICDEDRVVGWRIIAQ